MYTRKWRGGDYKKLATLSPLKISLGDLINLSDELELVVGDIDLGYSAKGWQDLTMTVTSSI